MLYNDQYAKQIYQQILNDVLDGQNLQMHLEDVNAALMKIEEAIQEAVSRDQETEGYKKLKNELFFLKFQILERM